MLPNVAGERATKIQIMLYSVVLVATTLIPPFIGFGGLIYTAAALVAGASFIAFAWRLLRTADAPSMRRAARLGT